MIYDGGIDYDRLEASSNSDLKHGLDMKFLFGILFSWKTTTKNVTNTSIENKQFFTYSSGLEYLFWDGAINEGIGGRAEDGSIPLAKDGKGLISGKFLERK